MGGLQAGTTYKLTLEYMVTLRMWSSKYQKPISFILLFLIITIDGSCDIGKFSIMFSAGLYSIQKIQRYNNSPFIQIDAVEIRILNIFRFPWASVEPPRAMPCGVSPISCLPQESSYIQDAKFLLMDQLLALNKFHQLCRLVIINISSQIL